MSVCNGDTYNLPEPTRAGYTFEGWYLGNIRIHNGSTVQLEGDCTLLAHWDVICYTVILDGNGGAVEGKPSLTSLELGNYTSLDTITLPPCPFQPSATDLTFKGWSPKRNGRELYAPGEKLRLRDFTPEFGNTLVFYAIWEEPGENPIIPVPPDPPEVMALSARPSYTNTVKEYTYDLAGNQTSFALARGTTLIQSVTYTYDTLGRLSTVVENGTTQASYTYTVNGARASLTYANGTSETYAYNLAGWVTNVSNYAGDELLSSFDYTYYADGSQRTKTTLDDTVTTYVYDGLGRLTNESVSGGTSLAYTYDARGNRATLTATGEEYYSVSYTYDAANRLLSELKNESNVLASTTYAYDANGNTVSKQQVTDGLTVHSEASTYNGFNQLTAQVLNEAGIVTDLGYEYYPDGIRGVKTVDSVPTVYLVNSGYVVAEYRENTLTSVYLWGANLIKAGIGSETSYYLYNAHGDVIQLTDEEGAVTKSYLYDAFGVEDEPSIYDLNPFRYCGEYYDRESGTYYLRARYYNPGTGRFTQEDPHWNPRNMIYGDDNFGIPSSHVISQNANLYVYSLSSPTIYIDASGHIVITASLVMGLTTICCLSLLAVTFIDATRLMLQESLDLHAPTTFPHVAPEAPIQTSKREPRPTVVTGPNDKVPNQGKVIGPVEGAPPISAEKQGKHISGHNNNTNAKKNLKEGEEKKSEWKDGTNGVKETQEGWLNGTELPDGTKVWDAGEVVGTKGETAVRVHSDTKGTIHGYPVRAGRYHAIN